MSVPRDATHKSAATAAADPPDDPPGTSFASDLLDFHGFVTGP